jgi:hypothetical protein
MNPDGAELGVINISKDEPHFSYGTAEQPRQWTIGAEGLGYTATPASTHIVSSSASRQRVMNVLMITSGICRLCVTMAQAYMICCVYTLHLQGIADVGTLVQSMCVFTAISDLVRVALMSASVTAYGPVLRVSIVLLLIGLVVSLQSSIGVTTFIFFGLFGGVGAGGLCFVQRASAAGAVQQGQKQWSSDLFSMVAAMLGTVYGVATSISIATFASDALYLQWILCIPFFMVVYGVVVLTQPDKHITPPSPVTRVCLESSHVFVYVYLLSYVLAVLSYYEVLYPIAMFRAAEALPGDESPIIYAWIMVVYTMVDFIARLAAQLINRYVFKTGTSTVVYLGFYVRLLAMALMAMESVTMYAIIVSGCFTYCSSRFEWLIDGNAQLEHRMLLTKAIYLLLVMVFVGRIERDSVFDTTTVLISLFGMAVLVPVILTTQAGAKFDTVLFNKLAAAFTGPTTHAPSQTISYP